MKEKTEQDQKLSRAVDYSEATFFDVPPIKPLDQGKGIQVNDYMGALDFCVKPTLRIVYDQLMENISGLEGDGVDWKMTDDLLSTFHSALVMWEQIDKKVMEDCKAHAGA